MFFQKKILSCSVLFFTLVALYFFGLGNRPFATPDEGRYVEIPREMVQTGDWLTPRLNGVKYFEKPPLFYWLQAATIKVFNFNNLDTGEFFMRLWVAIFALLGCAATYHFARSFYGHEVGLFSGFILGTSVLYFSLGRLIILDMPVSVLSTLALFSFFQGFFAQNHLHRRLWFYGFAAFSALGVLTKGVMALAIAGPIIVIWLTLTRNWGRLRPLFFPSAFLLFLLIAVPWHVLVSLKNPEFPYKYFIVEHVLRYTTDVHLRTKPFYFFIPVLLLGILPWAFFISSAFKQALKNRKPSDTFLLVWVSWVFGFFSLSNSKLIPYILPLFPALSIILGNYVWQTYQGRVYEKTSVNTLRFFGLFLAPLAYFVVAYKTDVFVGKEAVQPFALGLVAIFLIAGLASFLFRSSKQLIRVLSACSIATLLVIIQAAPHVQRPSIKELAHHINQHKKQGDLIISFMAYYQDLPVYTNQIVTVIEAKGELEFGTQVEDVTSWMVPMDKFKPLWQKADQTLWIVGRRTEIEAYQQKHPDFKPIPVMEMDGNVLGRIDKKGQKIVKTNVANAYLDDNCSDQQLLSHNNSTISEEGLKARVSAIIDRLKKTDPKNLALPLDETLKLLDEMANCTGLGRWLLMQQGLNGFWTAEAILRSGGNSSSSIARWMATDAPVFRATSERFKIFQKELQKRLDAGDKIFVSVPCGTMEELFLLNTSNCNAMPHFIGVDLDPQAKTWVSKSAEKGLYTFEFLQDDAFSLPKHIKNADVIVSNGLNIYIQDDEKVIELYKAFAAALKPNGILITSHLAPPSFAKPYSLDALKKQLAIVKDICEMKWQVFRPEEIVRQQLIKAGFEVQDVIWDSQMMFPTYVARLQAYSK